MKKSILHMWLHKFCLYILVFKAHIAQYILAFEPPSLFYTLFSLLFCLYFPINVACIMFCFNFCFSGIPFAAWCTINPQLTNHFPVFGNIYRNIDSLCKRLQILPMVIMKVLLDDSVGKMMANTRLLTKNVGYIFWIVLKTH